MTALSGGVIRNTIYPYSSRSKTQQLSRQLLFPVSVLFVYYQYVLCIFVFLLVAWICSEGGCDFFACNQHVHLYIQSVVRTERKLGCHITGFVVFQPQKSDKGCFTCSQVSVLLQMPSSCLSMLSIVSLFMCRAHALCSKENKPQILIRHQHCGLETVMDKQFFDRIQSLLMQITN